VSAFARISLFGIGFDAVRLPEAADRVLDWTAERQSRIVVTPNVDHVVMISERPELRSIYAEADLVLADGQPLIWAARALGTPLPERVAGSDLFPALLGRSNGRKLRVFVFGGKGDIPERAAARIRRDYPWVEVVGTLSPELGFENRPDENERAVAAVAAADADLVLVALGAPKQELWTYRERSRLRCGVALCLGATVDFMAGAVARAPVWMRHGGLEWLHRFAGEPRRLGGRYARDLVTFPRLFARELSDRRKRS